MAAVFYHNEMQLEAIAASRAKIASEIKGEIQTEVLPFTGFTLAEDYHQKHALRRNSQILEELRAMYPKREDLVASTAAARVNGYLAGYGECARLKTEIDALGLSLEGSRKLLHIVCGRKAAMSCPIVGDS
jgi:peptide-methionine (S)-S-oxide reductase